MLRLFALTVSLGLLRLGSVEKIPCTVAQDGGLTRYSVQEFTAENCHYWWSNSSNHVVATHLQETDQPVMTKSNVTLITSLCLEEVRYTRDCISEGSPREALCVTSCSGNAGQPHSWIASRHYYWTIPVAVAVVLLLVGLVLRAVSCRNLGQEA